MAAPALLIAALLFIPAALAGAGATFGLDLHHRFSAPVRRWIESRHPPPPGGAWRWPERGTVEYYAALARHDLALRGRALSGSSTKAPIEVTFSGGNETLAISSLGFLHYATVTVGTPGLSFLVALDTGSDLFWLPCDCSSCAPTSSSAYGYGYEFEFSIYSPSTSVTSQAVLCNSSSCELQSKCSRENPYCPYEVAYVSADTSSSGYLVEDVLSLSTEDTHPELVQAQIMFGCGQVQTGSFLDTAAPNGLFGLGMEKLSVPSILASAGLISDSFSMCFGSDGVGRISFGDQGSSDQEQTPFNLKQSHSTYNISMTGVAVGNSSITADFSALVDSGTSFTYLADPAYTFISQSFNARVKDKRYPSDPNIPFEYCYHISSNNISGRLPDISLTAKGGGQFPVSDPIVLLTTQRRENVYCLALVKSSNLNIIGQNFMTGLRIVFDRERMVLGWKKFNCYDVEESNPLPVNPRNPGNSSSSSAPTPSPKSYSPEATKETGNSTQVTVLTPSESSWSARLVSASMSLIFFPLLAIILQSIYLPID